MLALCQVVNSKHVTLTKGGNSLAESFSAIMAAQKKDMELIESELHDPEHYSIFSVAEFSFVHPSDEFGRNLNPAHLIFNKKSRMLSFHGYCNICSAHVPKFNTHFMKMVDSEHNLSPGLKFKCTKKFCTDGLMDLEETISQVLHTASYETLYNMMGDNSQDFFRLESPDSTQYVTLIRQ